MAGALSAFCVFDEAQSSRSQRMAGLTGRTAALLPAGEGPVRADFDGSSGWVMLEYCAASDGREEPKV